MSQNMDEGEQVAMTNLPHPHYFVVRPDMTFVPLIAVDEINPMVRIIGVPLSLTSDMIDQWSMARCGDQIARHKNYYRLEIGSHTDSEPVPTHGDGSQSGQPRPVIPPDDGNAIDANGGKNNFNVNVDQPFRQSTASREHAQETIDHMVKENKWAKENHPSKTKNAATPGVFGKKKFCTYWIRTGNCDYIQEGCKYLHVIPDEETRLSIGIRDMPRWAREELPAPRTGFQSAFERPDLNQHWRRQVPLAQKATIPELSRPPHLSIPSAATPRPFASGKWSNQPQNGIQHKAGQQNHVQQNPVEQNGGLQNGGLQNAQSFPPSLNFAAAQQYFPTQADRMAQQQARTPSSASPFPTPATSTAAESYQRQTQAHSGVTHTIPATPTSAANRYSPPTQPPISRPTQTVFTAPDKMPQINQPEQQSASASNGTARYSFLSHTNGNGQNLNSARENVTMSPLPEIRYNTSTFMEPAKNEGGTSLNESGSTIGHDAHMYQGQNALGSTPTEIHANSNGNYNGQIGDHTHMRSMTPSFQGTFVPTKFASQDFRYNNMATNLSRNGTPSSQNTHTTATNAAAADGNNNQNQDNGSGLRNSVVDQSSQKQPGAVLHQRRFVQAGQPPYISNPDEEGKVYFSNSAEGEKFVSRSSSKQSGYSNGQNGQANGQNGQANGQNGYGNGHNGRNNGGPKRRGKGKNHFDGPKAE